MSYNITQRTSPDFSPWDLLPAPEPRTESPPFGYFYDNVSKHLIKDVVRIMLNGLPIDLDKVQELEKVLDTTIADVHSRLEKNKLVQDYLNYRYDKLREEYKAERLSKCRSYEYYLKPFDHKKMDHRSYFMDIFATKNGLSPPKELLPTGKPKWTARNVKLFSESRAILKRLLDGQLNEENSEIAKQAMINLATDKAAIHNRSYEEQAKKFTTLELPPFNPASPDQKHAIFTDMLGLESDKLTDAYKEFEQKTKIARRYGHKPPEPPKNKYSWDRDNIENVLKTTTDPVVKDLCQALIDFSFGAIVKNNFIKAFYDYSIKHDDGYRLHGDIKLYGAKSLT